LTAKKQATTFYAHQIY